FVVDMNAVLDYLRKSRAITKFDLFGRNIGAGLSLGVGANRPETRKIIADGPWISLEIMKKKMKDKRSKEVIIPFGYDKNLEPGYACDKKTLLRGVLVIVSPQDDMINPQDITALHCVSNTYIAKTSPSNADNFSSDKNAYFDRVNKFLIQQ